MSKALTTTRVKTSPWHTYLTVHLPKLLSFAAPFAFVGVFAAPPPAMLLVSAFHIALLSQLGHKETRFVSYLAPLLNTTAARGAVLLWSRSSWRRGGQAVVVLSLAATALVTAVSLHASANNYAGGQAMRALHNAVQHDNGEWLGAAGESTIA